jgi:transposase
VSHYIAGEDRTQVVLFPDALDDYVGAESAVRVIDAFVDTLALEALGFPAAQPTAPGAPAYDPRALLKLYVYGYLTRVRSSRRLERETHRNVEVMWLLGRLTPDHKTISDFRRRHARALPAVFREFTVVCRQLGLFGAELVGIDGSKLRAVNAKDRSFTPSDLQRRLRRIDQRIAEYLRVLEATDAAEGAVAAAPAVPMRARLAELETRQAAYRALLAQCEATGATQVALTDPESRQMKVGQGIQVCYNVQLAVDAKHHVVAAIDVTNDGTDVHQLAPMARAAQAALGGGPLTVVADAGYHDGPQVAECVAAGITPMVSAAVRGKQARARIFPKRAFTYEPERDAYRCPAGAVLPFQFETVEDGKRARYYHDFAACGGCALRARCTADQDPARGRRIKRGAADTEVDAMAARLQATPEVMQRRKGLVEHPFGTLKRWDDASYFLVRGLTAVRAEFSLMALAYNLRRAMNVLGVPRLLAALRGGGAMVPATR